MARKLQNTEGECSTCGEVFYKGDTDLDLCPECDPTFEPETKDVLDFIESDGSERLRGESRKPRELDP
jgi:predicted  nucleic acid-binding Zn-ribbon protein